MHLLNGYYKFQIEFKWTPKFTNTTFNVDEIIIKPTFYLIFKPISISLDLFSSFSNIY